MVGLAESLRNELILYGIDVHLFLPATIFSPGFENEQRLKPDITKKIEGPDEGLTPDQVAAQLIKGTLRLFFHSHRCVKCSRVWVEVRYLWFLVLFLRSRIGLERNDFYITYEPVGHMFRNSRGITPRNNILFDSFWSLVGTVRLSFTFSDSDQLK